MLLLLFPKSFELESFLYFAKNDFEIIPFHSNYILRKIDNLSLYIFLMTLNDSDYKFYSYLSKDLTLFLEKIYEKYDTKHQKLILYLIGSCCSLYDDYKSFFHIKSATKYDRGIINPSGEFRPRPSKTLFSTPVQKNQKIINNIKSLDAFSSCFYINIGRPDFINSLSFLKSGKKVKIIGDYNVDENGDYTKDYVLDRTINNDNLDLSNHFSKLNLNEDAPNDVFEQKINNYKNLLKNYNDNNNNEKSKSTIVPIIEIDNFKEFFMYFNDYIKTLKTTLSCPNPLNCVFDMETFEFYDYCQDHKSIITDAHCFRVVSDNGNRDERKNDLFEEYYSWFLNNINSNQNYLFDLR